jgi:signal transduction histidine kinase
LYIVREIAQAHGGEVTLRSDNGETVFAVRLPRRN